MILGLVYGYVPFMVLPLYAFLDRIDRSLLEAARDLGASPFQAFRMVTLPLSMPGDPRGDRDHRAADVRRLLHARPPLGRAADEHTSATRSTSTSSGGQQIPVGAALVVVLMLFLLV